MSELAGVVVPALVTAMDKETDENNMLVAADTLGKWMGCQIKLQPSLLESVRVGLTKPKGLCVAYLSAVAVALKQNEELGDLLPLITPLANIVKEAMKKPSHQAHIDGVLAFRILLQASVTSSVAVTAIDTAKLWPCLSSGGASFLFSKALMQLVSLVPSSLTSSPLKTSPYSSLPRGTVALNALVSESLSLIVSIVTIHHPTQLTAPTGAAAAAAAAATKQSTAAAAVGSTDGTFESPVGASLSCLLHRDPSVRAGAGKNIRKILCNVTAAQEKSLAPTPLKMLKALHGCLGVWSAQMEALTLASCKTSAVATSSAATGAAGGAGGVGGEEESVVKGEHAERKQLGIPPSSRVADAVMLIVAPNSKGEKGEKEGKKKASSAQFIALVLLACAHPLVSESKASAAKLWLNLLPSLCGEGGKGKGGGLGESDEEELFATEEVSGSASSKVMTAVMSETKLMRLSGSNPNP